jgi:UDP-4-amino-4,6-dideoxy-N-acetyl-beta-L-altrosamine transaminase
MIPYGKQTIDEEDVRAVIEVLKSDYLTTGPKVAEFEAALSRYVGSSYSVAVNSGTSALDIAVSALELPKGSEIITSPFTFAASSNCILYNGCNPVFADIDKKTFNIDPAEIRKKITKKTKAIIYVDYAGQPCHIQEIKEIAEKHDLYLIEDACHALGAEYKGKKVGTFADMTAFSFHPVKHITTGEGGAITTEDEDLAQKLKLLRNHGIDKTPSERKGYAYDMKMLGRNYRIPDILCALGISQLNKLDKFIGLRTKIAMNYNKHFMGIAGLETQYVESYVKHAWHLYPIILDRKLNRDAFFLKLREKGIWVNVHYIPVYKFSYYQKNGFSAVKCPNTEDISSRAISLPMYSSLSEEEQNQVVQAVKKSLSEVC